jgi:Rad3-related DNA helicase
MKLPSWAPELRETQRLAADYVLHQFNTGTNVVMLDAPTGTGKTLIADVVRQELNTRAIYLCSTLALQDQFARDFPDAAILRGRSNYATADNANKFPILSAADCTKRRITHIKCKPPPCENCHRAVCSCKQFMGEEAECMMEERKFQHCRWCHPVFECPYEIAKFNAINSDFVCTNLAYFLTEANYIGLLPVDRGLIVVDEADLLEDQLLGFVTLSISERQQRDYGIQVPEKKTVAASWLEWAQLTALHTEQLVAAYATRPGESDIKLLRREREIKQLHADIMLLLDEEDGIANDNWIYTSYDRGMIEFKPIRVDKLAHTRFWRHGSRFLLMSATMISFDAMAESLGLR